MTMYRTMTGIPRVLGFRCRDNKHEGCGGKIKPKLRGEGTRCLCQCHDVPRYVARDGATILGPSA